MTRIPSLPRSVFTTLTAACVLACAWAIPRIGLGQGGAVLDEDLLKSSPYDRITLIDNLVIKVEPVSPRPLPLYDPKKDKGAATTKKTREMSPEGNVFLPGKEPKKKKGEEEQVNEIVIHRIDGEPGDFKVRRNHIKKIEYFEDLLIAEAERLILAREYAKAFEHHLVVKARHPKWRGLEESVQHLLFEEGNAALTLDNNVDRGLRLLRELHIRKPTYPGLADRLATAYGGRITKAYDVGAFREGRRLLHELETVTPAHAVVRDAKEKFIAKAQALADRAAKAEGTERLDLAADALRVWPALEGAAATFREAFAAIPTLDVGVIDLAHPVGPWIRSPADLRASRLAYLPVLARDDDDAARGRLPGQLAAELQKGDLGRQLNLTLRPGPTWSDGSRAVSAIDVVRSLTDRSVASSPCYNARWAEMLERVEATDVRQVVIRLTRAPLKPESWLLGPIGPAHTGRDSQATTADGARRPVGDGPYAWLQEQGGRATYLLRDAPAATELPKIRRIREVRLPAGSAAVGALVRGEISLLEHVPADQVAALAQEEDIKLGRSERPEMHQIAIDGRTLALRNRTLRRGLSYAIDRRTLLEETVLRHAVDANNALADGVFPRENYANAADVDPLGHDPLLARMLVAAGVKEMGGESVKLTFEYPARPEVRAIIPRIVEALRATGQQARGEPILTIEPIERSESELEDSLRSGRRFDLAYRVVRCGEPVTDAGPLICPGYDAPTSQDGLAGVASPRILQLLLQLEQAPEWPTAQALVTQIDREVRDELPVLPLWQLEDRYAWRARLKGPKDATDHLYHGIERWEIEPWFAKDPW